MTKSLAELLQEIKEQFELDVRPDNSIWVRDRAESALKLLAVIERLIEQRDRMTYNRLTEGERKLFFADKVLAAHDQELAKILEAKP